MAVMKATELDLIQLQVKIAKSVFGFRAIPDEAWLHIGKMSLELLKTKGLDISDLTGGTNGDNSRTIP